MAHREDLEPARVRDDRPAPAHELVQAAHALDLLVPRLDEEMEAVPEHHLVAEGGHLVRLERLHRRGRREWDERRRAHVAVRRTKNARAGGAVAGVDCEVLRHEPQRTVRAIRS